MCGSEDCHPWRFIYLGKLRFVLFLERNMSAITTTAPSHHIHTRGSGRRGGRGRGGKGGNQNNRGSGRNTPRNNGHKADIVTPPQKDAEPPATTPQALVEETTAKDSDEAICWICAEPVKYYSISECNHRTCHVCALRLRALYKKTNCAFCKVRVLYVRRVLA